MHIIIQDLSQMPGAMAQQMNFRLPRSPKCECLLRLRPDAKAAVLLSFLVVARRSNAPPVADIALTNLPSTRGKGSDHIGSCTIALSTGVQRGWRMQGMFWPCMERPPASNTRTARPTHNLHADSPIMQNRL